MRRILLVDRDATDRAQLSDALRTAGFATLESAEPWPALETLAVWQPDLVLLAWDTEDRAATAALAHLKGESTSRDVPVMLASADDSEARRVDGFQRGADDYVHKPYARSEVLARIDALLRRTQSQPEVIEIGGLRLDAGSHTVTADSHMVKLRPSEFRLLHFFMTHPDSVHSRAHILRRVWRNREEMGERAVDVHIRRLRQALSDAGHASFIQTVRGVGYRFSSRFVAGKPTR